MTIEIDPLTGAPIIKNTQSNNPPAFTVANDDVAKSLDSVASESKESLHSGTMDSTKEESKSGDDLSNDKTIDNSNSSNEKTGQELKRNEAGQVIELPTNPVKDKKAQLQAIKMILRNGMDSQQIEKAAKEIEKIL